MKLMFHAWLHNLYCVILKQTNFNLLYFICFNNQKIFDCQWVSMGWAMLRKQWKMNAVLFTDISSTPQTPPFDILVSHVMWFTRNWFIVIHEPRKIKRYDLLVNFVNETQIETCTCNWSKLPSRDHCGFRNSGKGLNMHFNFNLWLLLKKYALHNLESRLFMRH
jgi:hypothetical protein